MKTRGRKYCQKNFTNEFLDSPIKSKSRRGRHKHTQGNSKYMKSLKKSQSIIIKNTEETKRKNETLIQQRKPEGLNLACIFSIR